jgi:GntR family transcriptional regulator
MPEGHEPRGHELPSERVANDLRRKIKNGDWQPGEALPTVALLAKDYAVSTGSVLKALDTLRGEELIWTRPRWGSFVGQPPEAE